MDLPEKLKIAWERVRQDKSTDFLLGDFEYHAFHRSRDSLLASLAVQIEEVGADYTPQSLRQIRVPKAYFTTRPGVVPEILDRVYYQSLVDDIAHDVEGNLTPLADGVLHSYRYAGERAAPTMFHHDQASYQTFVSKTRSLAEDHEFIVVADVATFYERIYHHELENTLRGLGADAETVRLLMALLRKWRRGSSYGLPQGIWPSDYVGNLYLDPVDKFMVRSGYDFCRYVDDMRIGCDSYIDAQRALLLLESRLGAIGLALSGAKTFIVASADLEERLFPHLKRLDEIYEEIREAGLVNLANPYAPPEPAQVDAMEEHASLESTRALFREALEGGEPDAGVARFCLGTFRLFRDTDVLEDVMRGLSLLVEVTPRVVTYLTAIARDTDQGTRIRQGLGDFVRTPDATVYDWQRMWMLQALERVGDLDAETVGHVRALLLRNGSLHEAIRVQAIFLVGSRGDDADRAWMMELYDSEHSPWLKRAILFAIRHLEKAKRNHFYNYCRGQDPVTDAVIAYAVSEAG